jgi:hydrogenase expression/formation protein HypD
MNQIPTKFRDKTFAQRILKKIKALNGQYRFMHVCGTHQDSLMRFGLLSPLDEVGVKILQGPGCPVCVTTPREIAEGMALAEAGCIITSYGDMLNVPSTQGTLLNKRGEGDDVRIVYGVWDAIQIARDNPNRQVVFLAVGFETTAPATALVVQKGLPKNFKILASHRYIPPALRALLEMGETKLDGLIQPGHVSAIIGLKPYEFIRDEYNIPQIVAGFEPLDLLMSVYHLVTQVESQQPAIENTYKRVVKYEGNQKAQQILEEVFTPTSVEWRGFPEIPKSRMSLQKRYAQADARKEFSEILDPSKYRDFKTPPGCKCGEVLRGIFDPADCILFDKSCTPETPVGPCMVSEEGSCNIVYKYTVTHSKL